MRFKPFSKLWSGCSRETKEKCADSWRSDIGAFVAKHLLDRASRCTQILEEARFENSSSASAGPRQRWWILINSGNSVPAAKKPLRVPQTLTTPTGRPPPRVRNHCRPCMISVRCRWLTGASKRRSKLCSNEKDSLRRLMSRPQRGGLQPRIRASLGKSAWPGRFPKHDPASRLFDAREPWGAEPFLQVREVHRYVIKHYLVWLLQCKPLTAICTPSRRIT